MKKLAAVLVVCLVLPGCLVIRPDTPSYADAPKPSINASLATVYTYYHGQPGSRIGFTINGKPYFEAYWDTYSWVQLNPGTYIFKAQPGFWDLDLAASAKNSTANQSVETTLNVEAGNTYYLELTERGEFTGTSMSVIGSTPVFEPEYTEYGKSLVLVKPEIGEISLKQGVYIQASSNAGSND
ncbi:hypothetical protein [Amphritea sp.]|uniref:hypothetical protein n=1 Tax=Amphritea sp. TaxID=1872502 RepID=UPI003D0B4893